MYKKDVDPFEQIMSTVLEGFRQTTDAIRALRNEQLVLEERQRRQTRATYEAITGKGKSRYVSKLVEIERSIEEKGAQSRVAEMLGLSPSRITQLMKSER